MIRSLPKMPGQDSLQLIWAGYFVGSLFKVLIQTYIESSRTHPIIEIETLKPLVFSTHKETGRASTP